MTKPSTIRFRILDDRYAIHGLSDLTVRTDEFRGPDSRIDTVFVTENDINSLSFPNVKNGMLLFGRGYGFEAPAQMSWLHGRRILYWGDIDTHGFAILNQFRGVFPHAESFLMDRATLLAHRDQWVVEASPNRGKLTNLTEEESSLYDELRYDRLGKNVRLEQEAVDFGVVKKWVESRF